MSKILINGRIQRVEYESLPVVCFDCGRYRHSREIYSFRSDKEKVQYAEEEVSASPKCVEEGRYGPWMLLERKHRKGVRSIPKKSARDTMAGESKGSRFVLLCENLGDDVGDFAQDINVGDSIQLDKVQIEDDRARIKDDKRESLNKRQFVVNVSGRNRSKNKSLNKGKSPMLEGRLKVGRKISKPSTLLVGLPLAWLRIHLMMDLR